MLKHLKKKWVISHTPIVHCNNNHITKLQCVYKHLCTCVLYCVGGSVGADIVTHTGGGRNDNSSAKTMDVLRG